MRKFTVGLIIAMFFLGVLYVGRPLIMPFVIAVAIWYLINILAKALEKPLPQSNFGLPTPLAFIVALAVIGGAIYFASRIIISNISEVAAVIPAYQYNFEQTSKRLLAYIPWDEPLSITALFTDLDISSVMRRVMNEVTNLFGQGAIVAIYLLFLFLEQKSLKTKLQLLIPDNESGKNAKKIIKRIGKDIRIYLGIKFAASFTTAMLSYTIFKIVGLDFASFWAFLIFLFNFIPTVGSIVASVIPSAFAFMQFGGDSFGPFLVVMIGVTTLQMVIGNILEPRFQGDRLNLSPVVILLSLALWNMVWGIPGMFLCVPLTSIAMISFSHIPQTKKLAIALSRNGTLSPEDD